MPQRYTHRILQHVSHRAYQPAQVHGLAEELGVAEADLPAFRKAIEQLAEHGEVVIGAKDVVALPPIGRELTGRFKLNERGFGFVIPDETNSHGDLFVPAPNTAGALTGDRVRAEVIHRGRRGHAPDRCTGRVVEIIQRANTRFVGNLQERGDAWLVFVDGNALPDPVVVRDPGAKHASAGTKVVVELTHFPERNYLPEGVIVEVLGRQGVPNVEMVAVCRAYGLPDAFPDAVQAEASRIVERHNRRRGKGADRQGQPADRKDLRDLFVLTIDPPDAQDYDDAISIERTRGGWELGVHIADVAAFVERDSVLDVEAQQRGNSVYLPRKVIPMLPEVLSNGLCSLQPDVDRLVKSVFIRYDAAGRPNGRRFTNALIRSRHRLTYLEAQALIDGNATEARKHAAYDAPYTDELATALQQMHELSQLIRKRRMKAGMIVLDLPDVELVYDAEGHVVDAEPEDDAYTHKLIEAFMVEANEQVAEAFADLNVPLIRRIHPDPGAHDVAELRRFARVAGYNIPAHPSRRELQSLLESVRDQPAARAVHLAVLKTLTRAEYAPMLVGHFALASEHYAHFTSPIRRYPDLTAHRSLQALFDAAGQDKPLPRSPQKRQQIARKLLDRATWIDTQSLRTIARQCSTTERNAEAAERELRQFLVLQLLESHIGEQFAGTVTGVTSFGVFIQIDKYLTEGLTRIADLPGARGERWQLNEKTGSMTAQRSGRTVTIGDRLTVRINKIDLSAREMSLLIVDPPAKVTDKKKPKTKKGARRKR